MRSSPPHGERIGLIGQSIAIVIVEPSLLCPITIPIMPVT